MKQLLAVNTLYYVCPNCGKACVRPIQQTLNGFICTHCRFRWTVLELLKAQCEFNPLTVQYRCIRCSKLNLIFAPVRRVLEGTLEPSPGVFISAKAHIADRPTYGLCERCGAEYKLIYNEFNPYVS